MEQLAYIVRAVQIGGVVALVALGGGAVWCFDHLHIVMTVH